MLILGCGANTVRFRPALNVPLEDIKLGIEISRKAAKEVFWEVGGKSPPLRKYMRRTYKSV